LVLVFYIS